MPQTEVTCAIPRSKIGGSGREAEDDLRHRQGRGGLCSGEYTALRKTGILSRRAQSKLADRNTVSFGDAVMLQLHHSAGERDGLLITIYSDNGEENNVCKQKIQKNVLRIDSCFFIECSNGVVIAKGQRARQGRLAVSFRGGFR
jgi:hypothetical protein